MYKKIARQPRLAKNTSLSPSCFMRKNVVHLAFLSTWLDLRIIIKWGICNRAVKGVQKNCSAAQASKKHHTLSPLSWENTSSIEHFSQRDSIFASSSSEKISFRFATRNYFPPCNLDWSESMKAVLFSLWTKLNNKNTPSMMWEIYVQVEIMFLIEMYIRT